MLALMMTALKIFKAMDNEETPDAESDTIQLRQVTHEVEALIHERVAFGYEMPIGWLFKDLSIDFHDTSHGDTTTTTVLHGPCRLQLARNIARFGGAHIIDSSATATGAAAANKHATTGTNITHVVIDPAAWSAAEISRLRGSLAADSQPGNNGRSSNAQKVGKTTTTTRVVIPHLVSVEWVEECWRNRTLVDEEREFFLFPPSPLLSLNRGMGEVLGPALDWNILHS